MANRAEKLSREAVSHVFNTLCGKSDAPDKFTGMQREMNLYIKRTIQAAIEAGQESGKKELAREQYRNSKAMEQLQANFKAKGKESEERRVAELVARVDRMCNALAAQKVVATNVSPVTPLCSLLCSMFHFWWGNPLTLCVDFRKSLNTTSKSSSGPRRLCRSAPLSTRSRAKTGPRRWRRSKDRPANHRLKLRVH